MKLHIYDVSLLRSGGICANSKFKLYSEWG